METIFGMPVVIDETLAPGIFKLKTDKETKTFNLKGNEVIDVEEVK